MQASSQEALVRKLQIGIPTSSLGHEPCIYQQFIDIHPAHFGEVRGFSRSLVIAPNKVETQGLRRA